MSTPAEANLHTFSSLRKHPSVDHLPEHLSLGNITSNRTTPHDSFRIARASQEILLYLPLLSQDSATYCEGVFRLSLLKTSTFLDTKDTVVNTPPVYDYVGWWPSCHYVLHIERVWSTIVCFCVTRSKAFSRTYENGSTPLLFYYPFILRSRVRQILWKKLSSSQTRSNAIAPRKPK